MTSTGTAAPRAQQGFWDGELGHAQAWFTMVAALTIGMGLHVSTGPVPKSIELTSGLLAVVLLVALFTAIRSKSSLSVWLTGIPMALASTTTALLLALLGGVVPGSTWQRFGLESLWGSWPFILICLVLSVNLAGVSFRRARPLTRKNLKFLASHFGLLVVVMGGAFSASLMERHRMVLFTGMPTETALDELGREVRMPFEAKLERFAMETFPPTLAVARSNEDVTVGSEFVRRGMVEQVGDVQVEVLEFLPKALPLQGEWKAMPWPTAAPAARVTATRGGKVMASGWVSCGSIEAQPSMLALPDGRVVAMPVPRPKAFRSEVTLTHAGQSTNRTVEVNQPVSLAGRQLYQVSYDEQLGAASPYSVIEVVHDRTLPVVYAGLAMLTVGALWSLWEGMRQS